VVYRKVVVENRISFVGQVRAFPRDRFGNVYLIDPQVTTGLELAVRGGQLLGTLVGHLDGSYSQAVQFGPDVTPTVTLKVPDLDVVVERPIVSPAKLVFADVVVEARIGHEASPGANKHADPAVVLGDVSVKDPGTFLSLGGFGSVTVGVRGQVVLGGADDDVTVFARTDGELRSYRVEALTVGAKPQWMLLGESPGAVRSFGLGTAGLDAASAVRITDTSGRVRTDDFRETDSPGASLFGVGFRRTGPAPKPQPQPQSWWVCLLEWLRRLFKILARGKGSPSR
jgi:hypothetical protein